MIVLRFKVQCQPDKTSAVADAMADVVRASRGLAGVVHFDVARDVTDTNSLIATEVFEDADGRRAQEALPEVGNVMALLPTSLAAPPEATIFHVASSEPAM